MCFCHVRVLDLPHLKLSITNQEAEKFARDLSSVGGTDSTVYFGNGSAVTSSIDLTRSSVSSAMS